MTDKFKVRRGDTLRIGLSKKPGEKKKSDEEPRFGPPPDPEDPKRLFLGVPEIIFYDLSARLKTASVGRLNLSWLNVSFASGIMAYLTSYRDLLLGAVIQPSNVDPDFLKDRYWALVAGQAFVTTDLGYRLAPRTWPLAFISPNNLGLRFHLDRAVKVESGQNWKPSKSAEERLEELPDDATPEEIAALESEIDESSLPVAKICAEDVEEFRWYVHSEQDIRDQYRRHGRLTPKTRAGAYYVKVSGGQHFEPFDMGDTGNYLVAKRWKTVGSQLSTFENADEVAAPKLRVGLKSDSVKVFLVPRIWRAEVSWYRIIRDRWRGRTLECDDLVEDRYYKLEPANTIDFLFPALTNPLTFQGIQTNNPSFVGVPDPKYMPVTSSAAWNPADTSAANRKRLMGVLSIYLDLAGWPNDLSLPEDPGTAQPPDVGACDFIFEGNFLALRHEAQATITEYGAPVGQLVGAVEFEADDDHRYFIFRKTARTGGQAVWSGAFDDVRYFVNAESGFGRADVLRSPVFTEDYLGFPDVSLWPFGAWTDAEMCGADWFYLMQPFIMPLP